jgi:hypothetical protein
MTSTEQTGAARHIPGQQPTATNGSPPAIQLPKRRQKSGAAQQKPAPAVKQYGSQNSRPWQSNGWQPPRRREQICQKQRSVAEKAKKPAKLPEVQLN